MLKDHTNLSSDFFYILDIVGQLDTIDDYPAALMFLKPVNTTNEGRFTGAGRAADNNPFFLLNGQVDVLQDMELSEPFVHIFDFDNGIVC